MHTVEWELGADLYASILVDPALPIRMSFHFFPKEDVNNTTLIGRIGDLSTTNDVVEIANNPELEQDDDPYLTYVASMFPGRPSQRSYDFDLVFFDQDNNDEFMDGKPLAELEFLSTIPFKDSFQDRFVILDQSLPIEFFTWE